MISKATAPGKIILFGEHFVVHGTRAVVGAINKRVSITSEKNDTAGISMSVGPVFTSDLFYGPDSDLFSKLNQHGILGVEMEIAGLYTISQTEGVQALALVTVSDDIIRQEIMSSADRESTFDNMIQVALGVAKI